VECELRCVNFRRVSDPRRAFQLAIGGCDISDDWYRSMMGVIVMSFRPSQCAGENFGCAWKHLGVPVTSQRGPTTSLGGPMTCLGGPITSLGAPRTIVKRYGKNDIFFGKVAGAPANHSYYFSFNDSKKLMYSVCILIYLSI
jgi:hypothetical protein